MKKKCFLSKDFVEYPQAYSFSLDHINLIFLQGQLKIAVKIHIYKNF